MSDKRAILSVWDKSGIVELAQFLVERGFEILSTGGTAAELAGAGVPVVSVSDWTGAEEILGGRVKTLHPKVFAGILLDRSVWEHQRDADLYRIGAIDLVVVNLYPFEQTVAREGVTLEQAIERIDVGGPSMLRAAAKNHARVVPLCDPSLYRPFMEEMEQGGGSVSDEFRRRAAVEVFRRTAAYDRAIAAWLDRRGPESHDEPLGEAFELRLVKAQDLRYGENPQQKAGFYVREGAAPRFRQLHGKELSYNNLLDLDAAWTLVSAFGEPACTIVKHTNPCGTAVSSSASAAVAAAIAADSISAFGGILGLNRELDAASAEAIGSLFLEVVIAPSFAADALERLKSKKNLRLLTGEPPGESVLLRTAAGGLLAQTPDTIGPPDAWKVVTRRSPTEEEVRALELNWIVCAHVKSNAIVIGTAAQTVGIGAGQMSRVDAAKIAVSKATALTGGCVAASDAFFPFRDGLDLLADAGITAVVQPGGSVRDEEIVAAADERGLAMLFTGERHFRH
ncbi:MAG TPA: bifunctional phosphoribosylaminoimidazolecarboxamide formyltransferase/IMP cyclohydrolase [Thermoanaerobaculia bacterium]|nr:bifunctional phosphoribosylaminoimidazolecarboxamide formyltransferase/IMP cyclohydrolase [Thermoanaerobaculia bacterium]